MARDPFDLRNATIKATRGALNRTARKALTAAGRAVRIVYNIKAKDLRRYTKIDNATSAKMESAIKIKSRRGLPVDLFAPKQLPAGVTVKIKKSAGRRLIKGRFIAQMPNRLISVFERAPEWRHRTPVKGPKARKKILHGLPIERLYTIDPVVMFEKEGEEILTKITNDELPKEFARLLKYYISREL